MRLYLFSIKDRLRQDLGEQEEMENLLALGAKIDPVLSELWDNVKDADYDQLS